MIKDLAKLRRYKEGLKKLVLKKMSGKSSCTVTGNDGREFIFGKDSEGYSLYEGCDLIVGDVDLDYCVGVLANEYC